jgi:pyruvate kinase
LQGNATELCKRIDAIRAHAAELEQKFEAELAAVHPNYLESAKNLLHYIALRQADVSGLQNSLTEYGLSSLSACESHVMPTLQAVRHALVKLGGLNDVSPAPDPNAPEWSRHQFQTHLEALLGANPEGRNVEIMVTLPSEAASDYELVREMLGAGMDIGRINCAHDTSGEWLAMINNVRAAGEELGRKCRIVMDLAGPKVRTGPLMPGPGVLPIKPRRDSLGQLVAPRRIRLVPDDVPWRGKKITIVPVPRDLIEAAEVGDSIRFRDTRGRKRRLGVVRKDNKGIVVESHKRAYLAEGSKLALVKSETGEKQLFSAGSLPPVEVPIELHVGDVLMLDDSGAPGEPAVTASDGSVITPARLTCRPREILPRIAVGAPVLLNDGKIEGVVEEAAESVLAVRITYAKAAGSRLRGAKSINFPGTDLKLEGLTKTDRRNLDFVAEHADAVNLSFVREPADVIALQDELAKRPDHQLGVIVKIETEQAFHDLPRILLASMRTYPAGIMIARGDLAVECGWERLAEIQEEILWLCEAARIPVIWATQVLEGKAKKGRASRAEITDAAMSQRADCVMLNKGLHIVSAIRMLDDILRRMQSHQHKKTPILRKLSISEI